MKLVAKGGSRQEAHEEIRVLSHQAGYAVKFEGKENDLVARIRNTKYFEPIWAELDDMLAAAKEKAVQSSTDRMQTCGDRADHFGEHL